MEKKSKKEYNTEYQRNKRNSKRKQERGNILQDSVRININLKREINERLKEIALSQEKGVNQLLREIIEDFLDRN